jgi:phosphoserine aminotransferase
MPTKKVRRTSWAFSMMSVVGGCIIQQKGYPCFGWKTLAALKQVHFLYSDSQHFSPIFRSMSPSLSCCPTQPANPEFSSGPCKKRPGYDITALVKPKILGRSHRSKLGKARLGLAIDMTKKILGVPDDYLVGIVPASDTGAYEMAMWNMLGQRPVDVCHWESFGKGWFSDAISHLKLKDVTEFTAGYGELPDLSKTNKDHDICFTFNGTTSGVRVPDGCDFIADDRTGVTLCDATSACFAMDMPWSKLDVTTYSWQKVLGGEGAHGVLILSPRAVARLESYVPDNRPMPKIFRMTKKGKLDVDIFKGVTINTPSMLCVEDYIDALQWAESIGGVTGLKQRSLNNLAVIEQFVKENEWINFLAKDPAVRSSTSVCLTLDLTADQIKKFVAMLEKEGAAYDIGGYRDAPPSIRIWCGSTVDTQDVKDLMPWLSWAYATAKST